MAYADRDFLVGVILRLFTWGGVAFWMNCHGFLGKRLLSVKEKTLAKVRDAKVDYASQLPDDILSSILTRMTIKDAVKTSILSRRWRYLFASMPTLQFSLDMIGINSLHHRCCLYYQQKFLKVVNQFLQHYSGRKVIDLEMRICIGSEFGQLSISQLGVGQLMHSISKLGVERLHLYFDCGNIPVTHNINPYPNIFFKFSLEHLSQASSLEFLFLTVCVVQPSVRVRLDSLKTLFLMGVLLERGQLEGILSSCLNLNQLIIKYCKLPYKLCISGTSVVFADCGGLEEIGLQAKNLRRFKCFFDNKVTYFPTETQIFRNLRMLALLLETTYDFDIVKVSPVLDACPVLQYLDLLQQKTFRQKARGSHIRSPLSPTYHTELKEVRFGGFFETGEEIELCYLYSEKCNGSRPDVPQPVLNQPIL